MANPAAIWTDADESALLVFLLDHRAEVGDGANFKQTTWNEASIKLGERPFKGGPKTANSCKNKWAKVSGNEASIFMLINWSLHSLRRRSTLSRVSCHNPASHGTQHTVLTLHLDNHLHGMTMLRYSPPYVCISFRHASKLTLISAKATSQCE